jgi:hypothetical protein
VFASIAQLDRDVQKLGRAGLGCKPRAGAAVRRQFGVSLRPPFDEDVLFDYKSDAIMLLAIVLMFVMISRSHMGRSNFEPAASEFGPRHRNHFKSGRALHPSSPSFKPDGPVRWASRCDPLAK